MNRFHIDNFTGCLAGGAIGNALGYSVEFKNIDEIIAAYGKDGVVDFSTLKDEVHVSDDTQMSLFTANGILCAVARNKTEELAMYIYNSYIDWFRTQVNRPVNNMEPISWLLNIDELHANRAADSTCMNILSEGRLGSTEEHVNNSNGCGGIMRVAPIGLFMDSPYDVITCAAGAAALTHGNPSAYISAAAFALIISNIIYSEDALEDCIFSAIKDTADAFKGYRETARLFNVCGRAIKLAARYRGKNISIVQEAEFIESIGTGNTAEEAFAIAIYCSLMYEKDFERAVRAAVNHSGKTDTTGLLTGNILGALNGAEQLPMKFIMQIELYDIISEISRDLFGASINDTQALFESNEWKEKYIKHTYV